MNAMTKDTVHWAGVGLLIVAALSAPGCSSSPTPSGTGYATPELAVEALVAAAGRYDVATLRQILGPEGESLIKTEDVVQDSNNVVDFAAQARLKMSVVRDPSNSKRATLEVGPEDWPLPIPLVRTGGKWRFDSKAGLVEVLNRRIGRNELDAIEICHAYVEAQREYAAEPRNGSSICQYAQHILSTPGRQDGLAWQLPDSTWAGPVGEEMARVIAEGYDEGIEPYHGYYFKILKGQGPAAPFREMEFMVDGVMIGGFALVAAPAEYGVTGVMTFIVSHDDVVYQKDFGPGSMDNYRAMDRYNPDASWTVVKDAS